MCLVNIIFENSSFLIMLRVHQGVHLPHLKGNPFEIQYDSSKVGQHYLMYKYIIQKKILTFSPKILNRDELVIPMNLYEGYVWEVFMNGINYTLLIKSLSIYTFRRT